MSNDDFRQTVLAAWGAECLVCGRYPEAWLNTTSGARYQDKLSLHHINGDDTDDRVANVIPLCQSCHVNIHKVDGFPYRQWHRQLPIEHRNAWNAHYKEYYEGPRLNSKQAEWLFGEDGATPESEKYRRNDPMNTDAETSANGADEESTTDATSEAAANETVSAASDESKQSTKSDAAQHRVDPYLETEAIAVEFVPAESNRHRLRFVDRDDGPGWWQIEEEWTGHRWRPVGREPVIDVDITEISE